MPARSWNHWLPVPPLSGIRPFVGSSSVMPLREAGPWQEAADCSQMPTIARLAEIAAPDPPVEPRTTRSVSYGLHAWPLHEESCCPPDTRLVRGTAEPPGSPGPALNSCAFDF